MPKFGKRSKNALHSCDERLIKVFDEVIKTVDCSVLEGHRSKAKQNKAYEEGRSKLKYPNGNHNAVPSMAVDVAPYPIDWNDRERFHLFAGFVLGVASGIGIKLRWGGDWNMNWFVSDNNFDDLPHFEVRHEENKQKKG